MLAVRILGSAPDESGSCRGAALLRRSLPGPNDLVAAPFFSPASLSERACSGTKSGEEIFVTRSGISGL